MLHLRIAFFHYKLCFRNSSMWAHTAVIWLVHGPLPVSSTLGKQQKATYKYLLKYRAVPPPQSNSLLSLYPLGRNVLHVHIISCF